MRKLNAVLSMGILALFIVHAIAGAFQLSGIIPGGSVIMEKIAQVMVCLIFIHFIIGIKLTADTFPAIKKSGTSYFKENKLFCIMRISGLAVMLFVIFHIMIFLGTNNGAYRLNLFEGIQLASQLLLVLSVAVHVITNIKPLMISFGAKSYKVFLTDIILILSVLLVFMGIAFVIYYLRWNVF